jgi:hypothetical protein
MNRANHDAVRHNATALVISFLVIAMLLWVSGTWLWQPGLRLVGIVTIIVMSLALVVSLIVLWARRSKR